MKIKDIPELSTHEVALISIGFGGDNGLEELVSAARVAAPELANYLGINITNLSSIINIATASASSVSMKSVNIINNAVYSLGFAIDQATFPVAAPQASLSTAAPPPTVNLIPQMPAIRNQGSRGTCVAHAALAAYEHSLYTIGAGQDFSEQFLYWNCKRHDGIPNDEGTWLQIAYPMLYREGCCLETDWPYVPIPIAGNEGQNPPPTGAQLAALAFRIPFVKQLSPTYIPDLKAELAAGHCVSFSIPVFNSWLGSQWVADTGDITMPIPNEIRVGGHAMCLVGYVDMPNSPELGFGRFILRNSWGHAWGINSPYGQGYGTIPFAYLAKLGAEAYSIT